MYPIDKEVYRRISAYAPITSLRMWFGSPSIPAAVFALSPPPALFSSSRVKCFSRRTTQELRFCLWNGSTCGNKLRTMYLTRSGLSRPGVFLLDTNLLVTILKAGPHGPFSTSPFKFFQHSSRLFFMPCRELILLSGGGGATLFSPFVSFYGVSHRDTERGVTSCVHLILFINL